MPTAPEADPLVALADVLCRAVRQLGRAGQADEASRLAAKAWWVLREPSPTAAEHVNGVMHYLARLPQAPATPEGIPS